MSIKQPAATCRGLVKIYATGTSEVHALKGIDATFPDGSLTAVVGPSGSGKSSLLRIVAAMDRPTAGKIFVGDEELTNMSDRKLRRVRKRSIGYVFQRPAHNLIPYLTARQHLEAAGRNVKGMSADEMLERVGLTQRGDMHPIQLSGGEQQRVAVAQALMRQPRLVVADEPTASLDRASAAALIERMVALAREGACFIVSTHDAEVVRAADQTIYLRHGAMEAEAKGMEALSVIDDIGRIQLPPAALRLFPERRAVIDIGEDEIRIKKP